VVGSVPETVRMVIVSAPAVKDQSPGLVMAACSLPVHGRLVVQIHSGFSHA
jgi:hypothetical protein